MAGHNDATLLPKSTSGSADVSSFPIHQVPVTPPRGDGPVRRNPTATRQLSADGLTTPKSPATDIQTTPLTYVFETCSPLDHDALFSSADFFTPIPLSFSASSPSDIPDTPLRSRGRGMTVTITQSVFSDKDIEEDSEDWSKVSRSLFGAPPRIPGDGSFPALEPPSPGYEDPDSDSEVYLSGEYTATGTPIPLHRCTRRCIESKNPWFCPRAPSPKLVLEE